MILHRRLPLLLSSLALPILLALSGCSLLKSMTINPPAGVVVLSAVGQTSQFTAIGTSQTGSAPTTTSSISVTWSVTNPKVVTISSSGLVTAVAAGYSQIIAESGGLTATSDVTVTIANTGSGTSIGAGGATVTSIAVIPGAQAVASPSQTSQFIAIGTTSAGTTVNLTNQVAWSSSSTQIATVGATTGLASGVGQGTATITALYSAGSNVVAGTSTFSVTGGTTEKYTAVTITPNSQSLSASGQTGQFVALGTSGSTGLATDVTSSPQIKWTSSIPTIATVSASGLATGVSVGSTTITAELTNTDGSVVFANATVTTSLTTAPEPLISLTIIPNSITVGNLQDTGQFLAIGTYATVPYVRDLTNSPLLTWTSSVPNVFPVDTNSGGSAGATAGIVTAFGNGGGVIIAEATSSDGTIQTATATFNCPLALPTPTNAGSCYPGSQAPALLATLTLYNEGLNTTNWEVTAPSGTGTPNVLHCGPGWTLNGGTGGSVCVATYTMGTTVILKAAGGDFGGWSYNCTPSDSLGNPLSPATITANGPNYCTVTFSPAVTNPSTGAVITPANSNATVGAIFN